MDEVAEGEGDDNEGSQTILVVPKVPKANIPAFLTICDKRDKAQWRLGTRETTQEGQTPLCKMSLYLKKMTSKVRLLSHSAYDLMFML
jgi:hypothetical protein